MKDYQVLAIGLNNRKDQAADVQQVFTKFGDCILTRQGVHDPDENRGIITLNVRATDEYLDEFSRELTDIPGVSVQRLKFDK